MKCQGHRFFSLLGPGSEYKGRILKQPPYDYFGLQNKQQLSPWHLQTLNTCNDGFQNEESTKVRGDLLNQSRKGSTSRVKSILTKMDCHTTTECNSPCESQCSKQSCLYLPCWLGCLTTQESIPDGESWELGIQQQISVCCGNKYRRPSEENLSQRM